MNEQQPVNPRRRLQELLAIPERQRSDEQWDEINELEIVLASVNRAESREPNTRRPAPPTRDPGARRPSPAPSEQRNAATQGKKPFKKVHKRPPKANPP